MSREGYHHRRVYFSAYPEGPWQCFRCDGLIYNQNQVFIHHRDANPKNNDLDNLAATHRSCHHKEHAAWRRSARRIFYERTGRWPATDGELRKLVV